MKTALLADPVFSDSALNGRVALVTGGGSGIGFGIARAFSRAGAKVVIASRDAQRLNDAVAALRSEGSDVDAFVLDVRDPAAVQSVTAAAVDRFGGLDILVANAAGNFVAPVEKLSPNGWSTVIDIDLNGTFYCAKAALPYLANSAFGGRVIAITTTRALEGWPGSAHAGAAKAGVLSLIRTLALEWGASGIRCNTISPGAIGDTEGVRRLYEAEGRMQSELNGIPLRRLGTVEDISMAAVYLAADTGRYITGADLVVDGGRQRSRASHPDTQK